MHKIIKQTILNYLQATYTIVYEMNSTFRLGSHSQHCIYANIKGFKSLSFKYFWPREFWIRDMKLVMTS